MQGSCNKGDKCRYVHPSPTVPPQQVNPYAILLDTCLSQQHESSPQATPDSRARVTCKFLPSPGGCRNGSCPYLHTLDGQEVEKASNQDFEVIEDEVTEYFSDLCRKNCVDTVHRTENAKR